MLQKIIKTFIIIGFVALIPVWGLSAYALAAGQPITGRVLSCSAGGRFRSCTVAWSVGSAHGTTSIGDEVDEPGGPAKLYYAPPFGVTNRSAVLTAFCVIEAVSTLLCVGIFHQRGRSRWAGALVGVLLGAIGIFVAFFFFPRRSPAVAG